MISYKKLFDRFGYIWFVSPEDNQVVNEPAVLYKCQLFGIEKIEQNAKHCKLKSEFTRVSVNGHNGYHDFLALTKETYYKLWQNTTKLTF